MDTAVDMDDQLQYAMEGRTTDLAGQVLQAALDTDGGGTGLALKSQYQAAAQLAGRFGRALLVSIALL